MTPIAEPPVASSNSVSNSVVTARFSSNPSGRMPRAARFGARTHVQSADHDLAFACGITAVTAAILRERGYSTPSQVRAFFDPSLDGLRNPFGLPDIEPAIARLHQAIEKRETIWVFGDYDVDGVTSTALLTRSLRALGASVVPRIPERHEGYGLSPACIEEAHKTGAALILSADCGITAHEAAKRAQELNLDLIITDHHEPGEQLPPAVAVVNPKRHDSEYGFRELSGCSVAFKLIQALMLKHWPRHEPSFWDKYVELAAIAAIADCVPLTDENRIIAREGLKRLPATKKPGLIELMKVARWKAGSATGRGISFGLAPRLNAAGRIDSARKAFDLLMSADLGQASALALELDEHNRFRQEETRRIVDEAIAIANRDADWESDMAVIVCGDRWPRGIVGLVASRLAEIYARPAIVLSQENGLAHGSGRSPLSFDLHNILDGTRDLLLSGGGHAAACGLSLEATKLDEFRARALQVAREKLSFEDLALAVEADVEVQGRDVSERLAQEWEKLEPCGTGNPEPRLLMRNAFLVESNPLGQAQEHVRWTIETDGRRFKGVWWRPGEKAQGCERGCRVDICFVPELNHWNNNVTLQLNVKEARVVS